MNPVRSVFFWRILIISIIALLLANLVSLAAYAYIGKNTYISIEMSDLEPEAELVRQIYDEYKSGNMDEAAFQRLIEKQTLSSESAVLISDSVGKTVIVRSIGSTIDVRDFGAYFSAELQHVLSGQTVRNESFELLNGDTAVSVGIPLFDAEGNITGGIFIIKQTKRISSAFQQLNDALTMTILLVLPIFMILVAFSTNQVSKPLSDMANVAIAMSKGNFKVRADEKSAGETGILARALNTLCENLSQTIHQLQSEKRQLNQILSSLSDGVAALDSIGCLTHYNPALMKMFGTVQVNSPMDLVPDESVWQMFQTVFENRQPETLHYSLPPDKALWISIVPILDQNGNCTGVVGLFKDVTELERLEQTRRDYVANVSHELRTPLTSVRGLLEPLTDGMIQDEETRQRYYKIMLREVMRLSRLITDMLELSRLQSGTEHMEVAAVDMQELLSDIHQGYLLEANNKGINLILEAENVPYAMTDSDRVEQVLVILIDNAMHYTPAGGSIRIRAEVGERILISVTDTGCGIQQADLPHIFERFYKTDKSRKEGGTGLGLSIAKQIIDKLGENISVESVVNEGTSFHFTVKRYVSNAIALGPSSGDILYQGHSDIQDEHEVRETVHHEDMEDAPYVILEQQKEKPQKKNTKISKKSNVKKS